MNVPRWLRGDVWANPYRSYVRVGMETNSGTRAEVYVTRKQARQLRDSLNDVLARKP
jgi:hypothetical protein